MWELEEMQELSREVWRVIVSSVAVAQLMIISCNIYIGFACNIHS